MMIIGKNPRNPRKMTPVVFLRVDKGPVADLTTLKYHRTLNCSSSLQIRGFSSKTFGGTMSGLCR